MSSEKVGTLGDQIKEDWVYQPLYQLKCWCGHIDGARGSHKVLVRFLTYSNLFVLKCAHLRTQISLSWSGLYFMYLVYVTKLIFLLAELVWRTVTSPCRRERVGHESKFFCVSHWTSVCCCSFFRVDGICRNICQVFFEHTLIMG